MTKNFCTLFDKNYLYKGLALHSSMINNCHDFKLWILCMDEEVFEVLNQLKLDKVELIKLSKIEHKELISVKSDRNAGEYSWTCKPFLLQFILKEYPKIESITYLDSDLFFFSSQELIDTELKDKSIALSPHRFPEEIKDWENTRGKYNAGWVFFKNDEAGNNCLEWWKNKCLEWCYQRYENGKFGDQKYLDQFKNLFAGTYDIINNGVNLGPWSLSQYKISKLNNYILINETPIVLFHFHSLKTYHFLGQIKFSNNNYGLPSEAKELIFKPYYSELKEKVKLVKTIDKNYHYGFNESLNPINRISKFIKKYFNIV